MPVQILFAEPDFLKLVSWFPDSDDGILDTQDVLDACIGHQEYGQIHFKAGALSNLGIDSFQAANANEWSPAEIMVNALVDQIKEDCEAGDVTAVHEMLETLVKQEPASGWILQSYLRESTLRALGI